MSDLYRMADECPLIWLQLMEDELLAEEKAMAAEGPKWRKPGEKAVDARDRLREEREEAKRRLEECKVVHDRGPEPR